MPKSLKDNSSYIFLGCSGFVSILFVELVSVSICHHCWEEFSQIYGVRITGKNPFFSQNFITPTGKVLPQVLSIILRQ